MLETPLAVLRNFPLIKFDVEFLIRIRVGICEHYEPWFQIRDLFLLRSWVLDLSFWFKIFGYQLVDRTLTSSYLEQEVCGSNPEPVKSGTVFPRLATVATFQTNLCCQGAMTRRWAPQTRYTLRRITASIIQELIWFSIKTNFEFFEEAKHLEESSSKNYKVVQMDC